MSRTRAGKQPSGAGRQNGLPLPRTPGTLPVDVEALLIHSSIPPPLPPAAKHRRTPPFFHPETSHEQSLQERA